MYHNQPTNSTINLLYPVKYVERFAKSKPNNFHVKSERIFYIENRGVAIHMVNLAIFMQMPFEYNFDGFHVFKFKSTILRIEELESKWEEKKKQIMEKTGIEREEEKKMEDAAFNSMIYASRLENPVRVIKKSARWGRFRIPVSGGYPLFDKDKKLLIGFDSDVLVADLPEIQ